MLLLITLITPHIISSENINNDELYSVEYYFVDAKTLKQDDLPKEIIELLPEKQYVSSIDEIKLEHFDKMIQGFMFERWDGGISIDDKKIVYVGLWRKMDAKSIPHPGYPADAAAGSQYPVAMSGTISGETMHQTINGSEAICIEPEVRTYALPNTGFWRTGSIDSRTAEIIWLGRRNGASWGAIQAAVWNEMYGYIKYTFGNENVDPDSSTFNSNGSYSCYGPYYETQDYGGTLTIQSLTNMDEVGCSIIISKGDVKVNKKAKQISVDYMKLFADKYSLKGAKYGLYSDESCTNQIAVLQTDENGVSNTINVDSGTYYVKEISPSKGFKLDKTVHKAIVKKDSLTTIESIEEPEIGTLRFIKETKDSFLIEDYPEYYTLKDAEYTLYTDKNCTNRLLTIKTDSNGKTDDILLPQATYYLKETKPPKGFKLDNQIYTINISSDKISNIKSNEKAYYGNIQINKKATPSEFDFLSILPNNYSLENAEYGIYKDQMCTKLLKSLNTKKDGKTDILIIPVGKYFIKEIKASKGFRLDENIYEISIEDNDYKVVDSLEEPIYDPTLITLYKQNINKKEDIKYLDEVEFVLKYYDSDKQSIDEKDLKYTWMFKAIINENNEAEIKFDKKHYIGGDKLLLDENDNLKLPLGSFTIEEIISPQTYARDENIYVGHIVEENGNSNIIFEDGQYMFNDIQQTRLFSSADINKALKLRQLERQIILKTTAIFKESQSDHYVADGMATIIDTVEYDFLENDHEYLLKAKLINKKDNSIISEEEKYFKADDGKKVSIDFNLNLDNYDSCDFVVYEYLYDKKDSKLIAKHEDINDEDQTVHVDKLYRADMILYKIGGSKGVKLNGAIFEITSKRTSRDKSVTEKNLGKHITGGIFIEKDKHFQFKLAMDEKMQIVIDTIDSKVHDKFKTHCVSVLGLEQGVYYGQIDDGDIIAYQIEKGMIKLDDIPENSELTYTELMAPAGYYLDEKPYIVNVGDDQTLTTIENYRMNRAIIIPKTGID